MLRVIIALALLLSVVGIFKIGVDARAAELLQVQTLKADPEKLRAHVDALTKVSVPRSFRNKKGLDEAVEYIQKTWIQYGFEVHSQPFTVTGTQYKNILVSIGDQNAPRIVIGAHYDVAGENPGADDNASGVAGILELGRILKAQESKLKYQVDLVAYCLEEPPIFPTADMGSYIHASSLKKENVNVSLMLSLEMIGFFSDEENSQQFPFAALKYIYPNKGNFIGVVGNVGSFFLARKVKNIMTKGANIDVEFIAAPRSVPGIDYSNHRNYWEHGFPALMITDTSFLRNHNYHTANDTADTLNYKKMAEVVNGVANVALSF